MATTTTTPWVRDTRLDVIDIAWEVSVAKSSDRRARKPLTPGGDRAAGRKTLFATRTPVIAGCAPGDAPRASPTRSDERMVSCVRTLRFLEMLPEDILACWSVLGARQRERVDELDCLFQGRQKSRLKYIAPRANEEIRKSEAENEAENLTWRAPSVDRLESMESFQQDALRFGCLRGFKHMSLRPRGKEELLVTVQHRDDALGLSPGPSVTAPPPRPRDFSVDDDEPESPRAKSKRCVDSNAPHLT